MIVFGENACRGCCTSHRPTYPVCPLKTGGGGAAKPAADRLETERAAAQKKNSSSASPGGGGLASKSEANGSRSSGGSSSSGGGGGAKKRKMSNKEKFEFRDLEKEIESLGDRRRELEGLLAAEAENPSAG